MSFRNAPKVKLASTMILKLAANRLNIHKAKKIEQSISRKKDIADTLAAGKRDQAKIMVNFFQLQFFILSDRKHYPRRLHD